MNISFLLFNLYVHVCAYVRVQGCEWGCTRTTHRQKSRNSLICWSLTSILFGTVSSCLLLRASWPVNSLPGILQSLPPASSLLCWDYRHGHWSRFTWVLGIFMFTCLCYLPSPICFFIALTKCPRKWSGERRIDLGSCFQNFSAWSMGSMSLELWVSRKIWKEGERCKDAHFRGAKK